MGRSSLAEVLKAAQIKNGVSRWSSSARTRGGGDPQRDAIEFKYTATFARSMSIEDAMNPANMLCYEMNGSALAGDQRFSRASDRTGLVRHRQRQVAASH